MVEVMNAAVEKTNKKVVPPPTKKELQELEQDYIVQCTKVSRLVNWHSKD